MKKLWTALAFVSGVAAVATVTYSTRPLIVAKSATKHYICFNPMQPLQMLKLSTDAPNVHDDGNNLKLDLEDKGYILLPKSLCAEVVAVSFNSEPEPNSEPHIGYRYGPDKQV